MNYPKKVLQNFRNYKTAILDSRNMLKTLSSDDNRVILNRYATTCGKYLPHSEKYATSQDGQKIFQKYGFLNTEDIKNFNKVTF